MKEVTILISDIKELRMNGSKPDKSSHCIIIKVTVY